MTSSSCIHVEADEGISMQYSFEVALAALSRQTM
jgi:hypothetical protein